jgi:hypothetical protein
MLTLLLNVPLRLMFIMSDKLEERGKLSGSLYKKVGFKTVLLDVVFFQVIVELRSH